ncbi:MAG: hypothetical protein NTX64_00380 [Elusimicrobia bacterium]|nr:hypothetical protein [Elusimicrobiota bacterium]
MPRAESKRKVLLTSVCRPFGAQFGDAPSVGYELLYSQVTRAQGLFSPRALHLYFSLEYIAENLDAPAVVLQYPSKAELIRELKKGYEYVAVSFILSLFHKMKDAVALIRRYAPDSKIVLGGYGTTLDDETLKPYGDHICREEGVAFMRRLLGEAPAAIPYRHPLIVSQLKLFSLPASRTGMVFAGLGCANGCDFCCTSHYFKRKHIKLLPEGKDIYGVIERYLDIEPEMSFTILDEDFLLNKRRAMEFRDCVLKGGRALSIFAFASVRALSQYTMEELTEMGLDGFWIGYEGTRSGYAKQQGRPVEELFADLREHGFTVLASMILGFDYQDKRIVAEELDGLLKLQPCLSQFLIYGPTPGTPFYERVMREGRLRDDFRADPELYYRKSDGFAAMVKHPTLSALEIEDLQRECFEEDFRRLGPTIYRVVERWFLGYKKLKDSANPYLRLRAGRLARDIRQSYPIFLAGRLMAPTAEIGRWIGRLQRDIWAELGTPTLLERAASVAAVFAAAWTGATLKLGWFQHPKLTRTAYRMPVEDWGHFRLWEDMPSKISIPGLDIRVELQHARHQVWVRLEGALEGSQAERLWAQLQAAMASSRNSLVLDLKKLRWDGSAASQSLKRHLEEYRSRVRLVLPQLPRLSHAHPELLLLAKVFQLYKSGML